MEIKLNNHEFLFAANAALVRNVTNKIKGRKDAYGCKDEGGWNEHIEGACAEYAISKLFNVHWDGSLGNLDACDVTGLSHPIEVRSTGYTTGKLILHDKDKDENIFILITGVAPNFVARGWLYARDGKKEEFFNDPTGNRPAYFIPQSSLNPMSELIQFIKK